MDTIPYAVPVWQDRLFKLAALGMALVYLAGCFTPLHLHFDAIRYYAIKDCIELGCPPDSFAAKDFLPYGYTGLLIGLSKLGILSAFTVVLVNCLYLFASIYFLVRIFGKTISPFLFATIVLFHWLMLKFAAHPLSELQYIFFSSASLYFFHGYTRQKGILYLGIAFLFCLLTILTRTIGIALLPALFLGALWHHRERLKRIVQEHKGWLALGLVVLAGALYFSARQLKILDYTKAMQGQYQDRSGVSVLLENLQMHFRELGEVLVNMSGSRLSGFLPETAGAFLFFLLGVGCLCWIVYVTLSKKAGIPAYIRLYLLFYALIIFTWPYYDPRFWAPLVPLFAAILLRTPFRWPLLRSLAKLYLGCYLAAGALAAAYSLSIGFNKAEFARKHANGVYRNEYETHFFGKPLSDTAVKTDPKVVELLNKYD